MGKENQHFTQDDTLCVLFFASPSSSYLIYNNIYLYILTHICIYTNLNIYMYIPMYVYSC